MCILINLRFLISDITPPVITNCPSNIEKITDYALLPISWNEPTLTDNVGITKILKTKSSGSDFRRGTTTMVYYIAYDDAGNSANCSFSVTITRKFTYCIFLKHGNKNNKIWFQLPANFSSNLRSTTSKVIKLTRI